MRCESPSRKARRVVKRCKYSHHQGIQIDLYLSSTKIAGNCVRCVSRFGYHSAPRRLRCVLSSCVANFSSSDELCSEARPVLLNPRVSKALCGWWIVPTRFEVVENVLQPFFVSMFPEQTRTAVAIPDFRQFLPPPLCPG